MKRLFLTDIHFGSLTLKAPRVAALTKLVMLQKWDEIILGGDIVDLWVFPKNPSQAYHASSPFRQSLRVAAARGARILYIVGNHDCDVEKYGYFKEYGYRTKYEFWEDGKIFRFEHGHQYDPLNANKGTWTARLATSFSGLASLLGINANTQIVNRFSFAKEADDKMRLEQRAKIVAANKGKCDVYIYGHTHVQEIYKEQNLTVVNCGDIVDHGTYVIVEDGRVKLMRL